MKTIRQISNDLGISKEAVYKKLKYQLKEQLNGHVTKVDNVTHIDEDGEMIIRQSLHRERHEAVVGVIENDMSDEKQGGQAHLAEYVDLLLEQIKTKDNQLETQNGHIGQLIRQLGNVQMLTQAERVKALLLAAAKAPVEPVEYKELKKKSILRRFFKK